MQKNQILSIFRPSEKKLEVEAAWPSGQGAGLGI